MTLSDVTSVTVHLPPPLSDRQWDGPYAVRFSEAPGFEVFNADTGVTVAYATTFEALCSALDLLHVPTQAETLLADLREMIHNAVTP